MPTSVALRGVIFDLDGTVADTFPIIYIAFRKAFALHAGREFSDSEIEALFGPNEEGSIRQVVPESPEACFTTFLEEYEAAHDLCTAPFPGIPELLERLAQDEIRLAMVTGKGEHTARITLDKIGLTDRFKTVEAGSPKGSIKPQAIAKILTGWTLPADEVAYVGDMASDVAAARSAGVIPLAVAYSPTADYAALEAAAPEAVFRSVDELSEWLGTHVARR